MPRNVVGLDIGTTAIRAAEIRPGDDPTLTRFAQVSLPAGAVSAGEIADPDAVAATLRDVWRRGEFKIRRVALALANQSVVVRQVDVPEMDEADLRNALPYQVQDYIPMPVDESYLDSIILDRYTDDQGAPMMRVLAVAAHRAMVDGFVAVLAAAGLEPEVVDVSPLAITRAVAESYMPVTAEREAEAIVDIGGSVTNVIVHEHGGPRFVRILSAGGRDIDAALVGELSLTPEEAEAQKISIGLQPEGVEVPAGAATIIEHRASAFIDDVRRTMEYYNSQPGAATIERVLLTGGGSRLPRLAERIAGALRVPVDLVSGLMRVTVGDLGLDEAQIEQVSVVAATAVGAALED